MDLNLEKDLVEKAKTDSGAFSELYENNYSKIFGYILNRVANIDIAQDITSETFIKALKNIGKFKWKNISFSSWLYRIASNEICNYFRKGKYKAVNFEKIAEPSTNITPHDQVVEAEDNLKKHADLLELSKMVSKLKPIYQEVIALKYFEKKKIEEICQILNKKEGTIKSLIHRGINKLKDVISIETF